MQAWIRKDDKPKKKKGGSSSRAKTAPKVSSYTDDVDFPPNYDEEDEGEDVSDEKQGQKSKHKQLEFSLTLSV